MNNSIELTIEEQKLLNAILGDNAARALIDFGSVEEWEEVRSIVHCELVRHGFDENDKLNSFGLLCQQLVDKIWDDLINNEE